MINIPIKTITKGNLVRLDGELTFLTDALVFM